MITPSQIAVRHLLLEQVILNNGITVLAMENPAADIVSARIFLRAGSRNEPRQQAGLAHLVASVITKGTQSLSYQEIGERIESVGASLGTDVTADYFFLSLKTISADFPDLLALAAELIRYPSFPEAEVELERRLTLQGLRSRLEQPFTVASDQLRRAMYADHPYGIPAIGLPETVAQLERDDLLSFHQTCFRPDHIVVSIVGNIPTAAAVRLIDQQFGDWAKPDLSAPLPQLPPVAHTPRTIVTAQETQQAILMLAYLVPSIGSEQTSLEDYFALKLLSTYLGNGLSSRLFVELREKRGLAYEVSALYPTYLDASYFAAYMGTAPENTATALEGLQYECERLKETRLSDSELQTAKNKLLGQYALGKQTNAQLAQLFGWYEVLGIGANFDLSFPEHVQAVTPELAQQVAQRYLTTPYRSLVGPEAVVNGYC